MRQRRLLFDDRERGLPAGRPAATRRGVLIVLTTFLATRLVVWTFAYAGAMVNFRIQLGLEPPFEKHARRLREQYTDPDTAAGRMYRAKLADFAPLTNADGRHYTRILARGYQYRPVAPDAPPLARQQNIAFFPLYPLLCYPFSRLLGIHGAMILVAHLAGLAAALLIYHWVRWRLDETAARFTVAALFCLPTACYFAFGYAESLTLLTVAATLLLADRGAFLAAALVCGLATASRPTALALLPVLLLAWWLNSRAPRGRRLLALAPLTLIAASGLLLYAGYLTQRFGSPLVYLDNFRTGWVTDRMRSDWFQYLTLARVWDQFKYFGRTFGHLPVGLVHLVYPFTWNMPLNFFILGLSLLGLPRVPRSFRPFLLLGPLIFLHSYLASGGATFGVEPIARYVSVALPAFVVLGAWATRHWSPAPRHLLLAAMLLIQAAWSFHFGMDEWSG